MPSTRITRAAVAALSGRDEAYGALWVAPGTGPASLTELVPRREQRPGRAPRIRQGSLPLRWLMSLFIRALRAFLPMVRSHTRPIACDGSRQRAPLGDVPVTPYEQAVPETPRWLRAHPGFGLGP